MSAIKPDMNICRPVRNRKVVSRGSAVFDILAPEMYLKKVYIPVKEPRAPTNACKGRHSAGDRLRKGPCGNTVDGII